MNFTLKCFSLICFKSKILYKIHLYFVKITFRAMIRNKGFNRISILVACRRSDLTLKKWVTRTILNHPKKLRFENDCNYFDVKLWNSVYTERYYIKRFNYSIGEGCLNFFLHSTKEGAQVCSSGGDTLVRRQAWRDIHIISTCGSYTSLTYWRAHDTVSEQIFDRTLTYPVFIKLE